MTTETITLTTADGHRLAACLYLPEGSPHRTVLIAAAMGVPQRFYEAYAQWLSEQHIAVLTFDWRGVGQSAPASLRGCQASVTDWATQDLPAAVQALAQRFPGIPSTYLGHSLGGQLYGWLDDAHTAAFQQVLTVAAGNGYWRLNAPPARARSPVLWWLLVPVLTTVWGYFPGRRIGVVGDLPSPAMRQWRRWCLHPDYLGHEGPEVRARYAAVRTPITVVLMPDDELVSPEGIRRLYRLYAGAPVQWVEAQARDWGRARLGHFGLFRPAADPALWQQTLGWLAGADAAPSFAGRPSGV